MSLSFRVSAAECGALQVFRVMARKRGSPQAFSEWAQGVVWRGARTLTLPGMVALLSYSYPRMAVEARWVLSLQRGPGAPVAPYLALPSPELPGTLHTLNFWLLAVA